MNVKNVFKVFFSILLILLVIYFLYENFFKFEEVKITKKVAEEEVIYKSNIIENVNYVTKDKDGNEYIINASQGEIDYSPNIIYLTKINAVVNLKEGVNKITSDGRYNSDNFDTIFTKM